MKRKRLIAGAILGVVVVIGYWLPRIIAKAESRPLHGDFDIGMRCMGGHEIFLLVDESHACQHCPGHRDTKLIGTLLRSPESVTIIDVNHQAPWLRIDHDPTGHKITFLRDGKVENLPQVNNPWRTWLPSLFPE